MSAAVSSATLLGARGSPLSVEVRVGHGPAGFTVGGLPDEAGRELRDRVRAALLSCGAGWPQRELTVNLVPGPRRWGGACLDLAVAVGVLAANGAVPGDRLDSCGFVGRLGLDGSVRPVPGIVPLVAALNRMVAVVPSSCVSDAELVAPKVRGVAHLGELVAVLCGEVPWPQRPADRQLASPLPDADLADVRGHPAARTAIEVAAAGGHHLLLAGPPGSGKSVLARRVAGVLPSLEPADALDATMIHSAAGLRLPAGGVLVRPPLRAPHPTASVVSIVGGGSSAMCPGEVSCAHGGVLLLDDLGEFAPSVLECLRQPLDDGVIRVTRANATVELPGRFLLVAMNPCPCGRGGPHGACLCTEAARSRYKRRLPGPLLERFDLRVELPGPSVDELVAAGPGESSAAVAARVHKARERAARRGVRANADLPVHQLDGVAPLTPGAGRRLRGELEAGRLSVRGLGQVRRVARTIVDLRDDDEPYVDEAAIAGAVQLRGGDPLERWASVTALPDAGTAFGDAGLGL